MMANRDARANPAARTPKGGGARPETWRGALFMIGSCVVFAAMWALIRLASGEVHFTLMVFYRTLFGFLILSPSLWRGGLRLMRTERLGGHLLRASSGLVAVYSTFFAIATAPLGDVVAISYGAPLFTSLAAVLFFGERIRARRITAILVGCVGMLIVLRPGQQPLSIGHMAALLATVAVAGSLLSIKRLTMTEDTRAIVLYSFLLMLPVNFLLALPYWVWPDWRELALLAGIGGGGALGQTLLARAFSHAEATAIMPYDFIRLVLAVALGYALFGEHIDIYTLTGALVILAATIYVAHREIRAARP